VKRLVLIGAGHAHLVVLRSLAEKPLYGTRIALVTPHAKQVYSGMLPGILAGHYRRAEAEINVAELAERGYVEFVQGRVCGIDPDGTSVSLENGASAGYDFASINAGSLVDDASLAGAELALPVKPYDQFLSGLHIAERIAIVGAGAAGAEIAMAMRHRGAEVTLYSDKPSISERVVKQLRRRKVDYRPGMPATAIEPGPVVIAGSAHQEFDRVLLATGAVPLPWLRQSGLRTDQRGFVLVDRALRSISHPNVFALGDCATLGDSPHPKSGVYAVRHGETLIENLRHLVAGAALEPYTPQKESLALITCGARYAIAERGAWSAQGRWVWWWKDRIDRRWMRSFL
jgi:pyridine nucleotide-disulfide oxidoreductase family protein